MRLPVSVACGVLLLAGHDVALAQSRPDLVVSAVTNPPAILAPGGGFTVTVAVLNQGAATAGPSTTRFYLSIDAIKGIGDTLLAASQAVADLAIGASSTATLTLTTSTFQASATYFLLACADDSGTVIEVSEANNCLAAAAQLQVTRPDLLVSALTNPPAVAAPGSGFALTETVKNQGLVIAGPTTTRYYLSLDTTKSFEDTLLGSRPVTQLAPAATSTSTVTVTLSAFLASATYFVLACADDVGAVSEDLETNNCLSSTAQLQVVRPDLVTTALSTPPAAVAPGGTLIVTDTVQNQSLVPAGPTTTRYYFSADSTRSFLDTLLSASRAVTNLAAGESSTGTVTVTVPIGTVTGLYFLIVCADDFDAVSEDQSTNNCLASTAQIQVARPDLVTTAVDTPPPVIGPGATFTVSVTVKNQSIVPAPPTTTRFYFSTDTTRSGFDALLATSQPVGNLAPGASSTVTVGLTVPVGTSSGVYYLLACADDFFAVAEDSETNNCVASSVQVKIARPAIAVFPSAANFGTIRLQPANTTPAQALALTQDTPGDVTWTATASQPWITLTPSSGKVPASIQVAMNSATVGAPIGVSSATITISTTGANNPTVSVTLTVLQPGTNKEPFGTIDTPAQGITGVTGSIAVTGWALDDIGVARVRVVRDPVAGEPPGAQVFIGNGTFVAGARPDVAGLFATTALKDRAGWGYLMLTNFLPNQGNGTFNIYAYADDIEGRSALLGSRTITCDNAHATAPFGAIDTPGQGETVGGTVPNFGWVLSPGAARADPPSGGTVLVFVDGVSIGSPVGWAARPDLVSLFPVSQYSGIGSALGIFALNTTAFANGVHTIAWGVRDNVGYTAGVGSRFFLISNNLTSPLQSSVAPSVPGAVRAATAWSLAARRGFDPREPFRLYEADAEGAVTVRGDELDRLELRLSARDGHLRTPDGPAPLPAGARLADDGTFTWQPGPGFVGAYEFGFSTAEAERTVRIVVGATRRGAGARIVIDRPAPDAVISGPFDVAGWAADLDATAGNGIDTIHLWALPVTGAQPLFLGVAALGGARSDVAAIHGEQFEPSGYGASVAQLPPGTYDLAVFAWSHRLAGFLPARIVRVSVR